MIFSERRDTIIEEATGIMVYIRDVSITYHNIYKIRPVPQIMDKVYYPAQHVQPESRAGIPFMVVWSIQTDNTHKAKGLYPSDYFINTIINKRDGGMIHNGRNRVPC
jgi:hypothetical protein